MCEIFIVVHHVLSEAKLIFMYDIFPVARSRLFSAGTMLCAQYTSFAMKLNEKVTSPFLLYKAITMLYTYNFQVSGSYSNRRRQLWELVRVMCDVTIGTIRGELTLQSRAMPRKDISP